MPGTIHEEKRGGECSRCHTNKPGVKAFLLQSNPSFNWPQSRELTAQSMPDVTLRIVCKECLTDEEIAILLAPIASFVIEALFLRRPPVHDAAAMVRAMLLQRHGGMDMVSHRSREKALETLG